MPTEPKIALYRIVQEALNNAAKHAAPSRAQVDVRCDPARVELLVSDNGPGFDPSEVSVRGLGLGNMKQRAAAIGARLEIDSRPGAGTTVRVVWEAERDPD